jgi:hypothetical protein
MKGLNRFTKKPVHENTPLWTRAWSDPLCCAVQLNNIPYDFLKNDIANYLAIIEL